MEPSKSAFDNRPAYPTELLAQLYGARNGSDPVKVILEFVRQQDHGSLDGFWNSGAAVSLLVVDFLSRRRRKEIDAILKAHLGPALFSDARDAERVFRTYRGNRDQYERHGIAGAKKYGKRGSTRPGREQRFKMDTAGLS
jgi:hypothetical protein